MGGAGDAHSRGCAVNQLARRSKWVVAVISKELLGRAHGALSVAGNGPCVGVLRELVEAIEAEGGGSEYPTLHYRSREVQANLGLVTVDYLRQRSSTELRFMQIL